MQTKRRYALTLGSIVTASALLLAGCGSESGDGGKIELTIGTFGEFGYEELYAEYERIHPNIDIKPEKTGQGGPYHEDLFTKLGAGSGLHDIMAVEEAHMPDVLGASSRFNDLTEIGPANVTPDRWLRWKYQAGTDQDGRLIGYGTDIGPLAMCYRKDMLRAAGLPSDPQGVEAIFSDWDAYLEAGEKFVANSEAAWFDSGSQVFNVMQNQLDVGYVDRQGALTIETNPKIKQNWDLIMNAIEDGQSAKLVAFSDEWNQGFASSAFATKVCPSWMLGIIEEQAGKKHAGKWAVSEYVPGGGGNWGGSYLTVPTQTDHPEEAAALAAWLTAPEQQIKAFEAKGPFPSQVDALQSDALLSATNDYFGGIKDGELFAKQATKIEQAQYKGPGDGQIQENALATAVQAVEEGSSPQEGWTQLLNAAKRIVG